PHRRRARVSPGEERRARAGQSLDLDGGCQLARRALAQRGAQTLEPRRRGGGETGMVVGEEPGEGPALGHAELVDQPASARRADAVEETEHPVPCELVARVLEDAEEAQQVLDVRAL